MINQSYIIRDTEINIDTSIGTITSQTYIIKDTEINRDTSVETYNNRNPNIGDNDVDQDTEDESNDNIPGTNLSKASSNKISIGAIIGIISGIVVLIAIATIIFCLCKKSMKKKIFPSSNPHPITEDGLNNSTSQINQQQNAQIYTFNIKTTSQHLEIIKIESDKTFEDLIKKYFQKIGMPELFNEPTILFLFNGNFVQHNSKDLLKNINKKNNDNIYAMIVDDQNNKMKFNN